MAVLILNPCARVDKNDITSIPIDFAGGCNRLLQQRKMDLFRPAPLAAAQTPTTRQKPPASWDPD
jgi:hypothetical protein